jgi:hypothetical protein
MEAERFQSVSDQSDENLVGFAPRRAHEDAPRQGAGFPEMLQQRNQLGFREIRSDRIGKHCKRAGDALRQ